MPDTTTLRTHAAEPAAADLPVNAVEIEGLCKTYRASGRAAPLKALSDVGLEIPRGSLFGLLGPNGAGKSTLINIMAGLVTKTSGTVRIWGSDIDKGTRSARASIGVVPQELNIDPFFTPHDLLELQAGLYGVPPRERRTAEILGMLGLADKADAYTRTLSGGMRRRLMVAKAMVHNPPILVLDEPTAGVDIELRQQLWGRVKELNRLGTTILLTTHYLEEAEELCDTIAIINRGQVIACEPTGQLVRRLDNKELQLVVSPALTEVPEALAPFEPELAAPDRLVFHYRTSGGPVGRILAAVQQAGLEVVDLRTEEADLEDIFLQLTRGAHDAPAQGPRQAPRR